ncbi:MAG: hypothetical protein SNJ55_01445 [Chloroherpetonaceae bacterium]
MKTISTIVFAVISDPEQREGEESTSEPRRARQVDSSRRSE